MEVTVSFVAPLLVEWKKAVSGAYVMRAPALSSRKHELSSEVSAHGKKSSHYLNRRISNTKRGVAVASQVLWAIDQSQVQSFPHCSTVGSCTVTLYITVHRPYCTSGAHRPSAQPGCTSSHTVCTLSMHSLHCAHARV